MKCDFFSTSLVHASRLEGLPCGVPDARDWEGALSLAQAAYKPDGTGWVDVYPLATMGAASSKPQTPAMSQFTVKRESVDEKTGFTSQVPLAAPLSADGTISLSSVADCRDTKPSTLIIEVERTRYLKTIV